LVLVGGNGRVGHLQDLRRAAIVGFDGINHGAGVTFGKGEDVSEVRAAPGVDALRVVPTAITFRSRAARRSTISLGAGWCPGIHPPG
jgi:hypothetical protein